jgi:hypothetical protein
MPEAMLVKPGSANTEATMVAETVTTWNSIPEWVSTDIPPLSTSSQAYYWTRIWQQGEKEALAELNAGKGRVFGNARDAIRWLLDTKD